AIFVLRPAIAGRVPIWTKGPAVWDGVSFSAMSGIPILEAGRMASAQHDVEAVCQAVERLHALHVQLRDEAGNRRRILDRVDDGAARDQRIALEIELRDQALHEGMAEDRQMDVGRSPGAAIVRER